MQRLHRRHSSYPRLFPLTLSLSKGSGREI
jgi:hypothetical protein